MHEIKQHLGWDLSSIISLVAEISLIFYMIMDMLYHYDEVQRFRKSAAKCVSENALMLHQMMGFTKNVGLVFGWYDNSTS